MKLSYFPNADSATPLQRKRKNRLIATMDTVGSLIYFAIKGIPKAFDSARLERSIEISSFKNSVALGMDWMGKPKDVFWASKGLFATIRNELEEMGLLQIVRQRPGLGRKQKITRVYNVDFKGLLRLHREIAIEMNRRAAKDDSFFDKWPKHGFKDTQENFRKFCGYDLFSPGEGFGETEEEVEALNEAQDDAQDDRWQEHEDRHILHLEQALENACEWYLWKFKEPIPDDSFLAPNDQDPRSRQIHWDTHRWNTFRQDLWSGLCTSWHDFDLNGIERLVLG